jgi:hypothetical protein
MFRLAVRTVLGVALALSLATHAAAITAWDQAKVPAIAGRSRRP